MTETRTFDINQFITERANDRAKTAKTALTSVLVDSDAFDAAGEVLELGAPLVVAAVLRRIAQEVDGATDAAEILNRHADALEFDVACDDDEPDGAPF